MRIREVKSLKSKKGRDEWGLFIVEGEKLVAEIPADWQVKLYLCAESYARAEALRPAPVMLLPDSRFASVSDTKTPQGVMAVCEMRRFGMEDLAGANVLLIGEALSDPGNIGTLIRTAAAARLDGVILSEGSGDVYNPKIIRAAAGASLRLPVVEGADLQELLPKLKEQGFMILALHLQGDCLPYELDLADQKLAILVGNEAHGLSDRTAKLADVCVKLPMAPGIESLNASVAGGILMYELVRQASFLKAPKKI